MKKLKSPVRSFLKAALSNTSVAEVVERAANEFPVYGGIYVVQAGEETSPVKIGHAACIQSRIRNLQTAHHIKLRLVYHEQIDDESSRLSREAYLHRLFQSFQVRGEWFKVDVLKVLEAPESILHRLVKGKT